LKRLSTGEFEEGYDVTNGANVVNLELDIGRFQVVDTSGQENIGPLRAGYYEGTKGCVVMFDVLSAITAADIQVWIDDYQVSRPDGTVVIVANKTDSPQNEWRMRAFVRARNWAERRNFAFVEMSVRGNINVETPLQIIQESLNAMQN
jgi:GTPase SAR1 family protein